MASGEIDYSKINDYPVGADRLFKVMMRVEFALKEIGYCRPQGNQAADVDWDRFAQERLGKVFFHEIQSEAKVGVLIQKPPMRQSVDTTGHLCWKPTGTVTNTQELIGALRRVRNNLFHGGKSGDPDKERNAALVADALHTIDAILRRDDDLRTVFQGSY